MSADGAGLPPNQPSNEPAPLSRREALARERATSQTTVRPVVAPRLSNPSSPLLRSARRASTPGRPQSSARPSGRSRPASAAQRTAKAPALHALVIGLVTAVTVAVSTPAESLMTSADVQAKQIAAAGKAQAGSQLVVAGGDAPTLSSDSYDASSMASFAAASGITEIEDTFTNNPSGTVQWPFAVGVHIGDRFGSTAGRASSHHGLDFNPGVGAPIQAIADGVVSFAEDGEGDLGVHLMITHVIDGQTVTSVYAHMQHSSMRFKLGDTVKVGQVVGTVGSTGNSTGPHLHFEIRLGGTDGPWTDPLPWLRSHTN